MKTTDILVEYYDVEADDYSVVDIDHSRRPLMTLKHLQKLRKTRAIEEIEWKQRIADVAVIYGQH